MSLGQVRVCHQINLGGKKCFQNSLYFRISDLGNHFLPHISSLALSCSPSTPLKPQPPHLLIPSPNLPGKSVQIPGRPLPPRKVLCHRGKCSTVQVIQMKGAFFIPTKHERWHKTWLLSGLGAFGMLGDSMVAVRQSIKVSLDSIINGSHQAQLLDGLWVARSEFSKGTLRGEDKHKAVLC